MRRKGVSKEHRPDPIIQMGLFMDTDGIPLTYGLFPGNTLDKKTLIPMIEKVRTEYTLGRIIIVADREKQPFKKQKALFHLPRHKTDPLLMVLPST